MSSSDTPKPGKEPLTRAIHAVINTLVVFIVASVAILGWDRIVNGPISLNFGESTPEAATPTPPAENPSEVQPGLPPWNVAATPPDSRITRAVMLDTNIPTRPRVDVITYTVQRGDSLFSIADEFGLKPETILWGNFDILEDNPHMLKTDQNLKILPVNGTYYQWDEDDHLNQIASFFKVEPQVVLEYPGNRFDLTEATPADPGIEPGAWLIIPGGKRAIKDWGPPAITRSNPASARYYGPGHCGAVYEGAIGIGTFVWPTTSRNISGYTYDPVVHPAIDIGGQVGNAIYAVDNGVVVYAGWSDWGYGYLIVIDHGTGWQSAYAHLSAVGVGCGQSVFQGTMIGGLGSTGNSSGPHLHFEMVYMGAKVNPMNFLQP